MTSTTLSRSAGALTAWLLPVIWLVLLMGLILGMPQLETLLRAIEPSSREVLYSRDSLLTLLISHILVVGVASLLAIIIGVGASILVTRPWGRDFLPLISQLASIGQTFPPVAVLALAVPWLGFGTVPTIMALLLYGLLPIVRNTLVGIQGIEPAVLEAARGMGMSPRQRLWRVELPLAAPVIVAGIRTSITINIATAAIGSTIGAKTLGDPIIAGIVNGNTAYILQGAVLIALLALVVDSSLERLGHLFSR
ncbi:ABC transporter permease [Pistricoccus aurantiacus]|uniref:ABC transporter permease n=1 Tax=Pistricoccus aurantiacus TaxID=1883414 RepID=UPI0016484629|nr:ABC transporter permease [Pistricoccus aurantiacus]